MTETVACPKHGDRPAVAAIDAPTFTVCRACWYLEWLRLVLGYGRRTRLG